MFTLGATVIPPYGVNWNLSATQGETGIQDEIRKFEIQELLFLLRELMYEPVEK